ncbi:hypothetical protein HXA34_20385 [Salipaludibacillus agaradhaerens]|uniref:hypothetical protein n=1 Tax=Salipaludibacillus agaradhaerens TaxID=76935 RepID=UPI0021512AFF|nr:hypothetical protein [Salipaludibacillus agaradhaerens]MCR6108656.1 hypothetical protein [Salipaludibacillus agaradhaerens]MCR6120680.1 hypothetical protein [Salipaludibacillus agaradhaerens]
MKYITISALKWSEQFNRVNGSYYDYAAEIYAPSEAKEREIRNELFSKGWRAIETKNTILLLFEKERHIIRIFRLWR